MKPILLSLAIALLMVGCGESSQPSESVDANAAVYEEDAIETHIDYEDLEDRDGVMYLPNEETPFTGQTKTFFEFGQKESEGNFKDGKRDGLNTAWYQNGKKEMEITYKDGKYHGPMTMWHHNGHKSFEGNFTNGIKEGLRIRYQWDGTESSRETWKDGEQVD